MHLKLPHLIMWRERESGQDLVSWHMFDWTHYRLCHMVSDIRRPGGFSKGKSIWSLFDKLPFFCHRRCFWVVAVANMFFLIIVNLFSFQVPATSSMQNTFQKPMGFVQTA